MIASRRSPRLNAANRHSSSSGEERARPNGQIAVSIGHCAIPIDLNDGPAALLYRNLTTPSLPDVIAL